MNTIAKKIKELRKESKITQQQLANFINVGQSTIVGWEKGEYEPTASNIKMLAIFFNVTSDYLLGINK